MRSEALWAESKVTLSNTPIAQAEIIELDTTICCLIHSSPLFLYLGLVDLGNGWF